jgi:transposase/predicted RNA-binding Zn-ribbon protein involved in translation (DUF1610 family)
MSSMTRSATLHARLLPAASNFDRRHMTVSTPDNCLACGKPLPIPHSIAMHFCPGCSADPARTIKAETGRYPRRSDTLRSGVKVDRLVQDFKRHGSIRRIAKQYGLSRPYVTALLRRKGCMTDQRVLKAAAKHDRIIQAFRERPSMKWICKQTHSAADYVREVLQEAGFETPTVQRKIEDWKAVIDLYNGGLSTREIGKRIGVGDESIRRGLDRRGIARRPNTAGLKERHAKVRAAVADGKIIADVRHEPVTQQMIAIYLKLHPEIASNADVRKVFGAVGDSTIRRARNLMGISPPKDRPRKTL